ncbi:dTDP-4-dehydrorhamnose 3,5-epimerase [Azospirillum sp.]|uniref:dTDP-4-dehydrorhamnose 3,5-epimerase n=1 Tax=Azospirillum sp. TaxID=34012 RepID=UPI002D2EFD24|nr:dTDP-4-dehydrorhamnose 3,5-epimerase [Azospirillum sp.]HYD69444.1 dTDP-4-dehydrorhamnose 3,5-epimerase [Azospirillum sp.]
MQVIPTAIPEVKLLVPRRFDDDRGWFVETYNRRRLAELAGITEDFVQDNMSLSAAVGTIRGLHFQAPPHAQGKLVGVVAGAVLDVAVDIREGSPNFGRHVAARLSAAEGNQMYVPAGFAHGFCTLEPNTVVSYKVTDVYAPECDGGIAWNDPDLGIDWPVTAERAALSDKDRALPRLADLPPVFRLFH